MTHYIVFPPVGNHWQPSSTLPMAQAVGPGTRSAPISSLGGLLRARRVELIAFANVLLASAAGLGGASGAFSLSAAFGAAPTPVAIAPGQSAAPGSEIGILEGIGALVVPEHLVDRVAAAGILGAIILENVLVPCDLPRPAQPAPNAALPARDWHLHDIDVATARAQGFDGAGKLIGVVDTGIDAIAHPEFAGKTIHFAEFDALGRVISTTMRDAGHHGTHVCGIAAGLTQGVAPKADLAVAAVLTISSSLGLSGYLAQILGGLNWLLTTPFDGDEDDPGVDVINASLGSAGYMPYYYSTLAGARMTTGTVLAAAVGNGGPARNRHGSPGNYDIVVGVGALEQTRDVASFSDWGDVSQHPGTAKPDLCAPGSPVWSSLPRGKYGWMSGTSMASPVVAGALALLLQKHPAFGLNAAGLVAALHALAQPLTGVSNTLRGGRGRLDLSGF